MRNSDVIASDHPLDARQQARLDALLATLIPASDERGLPGADEVDLLGYVAAHEADFMPVLSDFLAAFVDAFVEASAADRQALVTAFSESRPELFEAVLFQVYACYYQDPRVLAAIGAGAGPPFPRGNEVEGGDLSLLDPVIRAGRSYRKP